MQANEITFQRMVEGTKQFQVPLYQRPYSWGKKELHQLWSDIVEQMAEGEGAESPWETATGHFLGSVVLAPATMAASDLTRWLLIDGQQRLTTLTIAFAAIRDRLRALESDKSDELGEADRVHNTYLVNQYKKHLDRYRVLPTQSDLAAFRAIIDSGANAGGSDKIGYSYNYFAGRIRSYSTEELLALEATIGRGLSLVQIEAEQSDNVFRIFESLNNTGKSLSQTDLLRNYVFMLLPETGQEVYDEVWLPMQSELGPENLEVLAWLDLVLRGDENAKQREVYRTQQQRLEKIARAGGEQAVREELEELRHLGGLLLRIVEPDHEDDPGLRRALTRLAEWGNTIYRPLALKLMVLRDEGHASTEQVERALGHIESYLVRRMFVRIHTQGLNIAFLRSPAKLVPGEPVDELVHRYLSNPRLRWPSDEDLVNIIMKGSFYWTGRSHQRLYIMRRLEETYAPPGQADFPSGKMVLNHVMPSRPTPSWEKLLENQADYGETGKELQERLHHTLGNLVLVPEGTTLSGHMIERKQQIRATDGLRMNQEVADAMSWGRPEIEERSSRLAERAIAVWPSPRRSTSMSEATLLNTEPISQVTAMIPAGRWATCQAVAQVAGSAAITVSSFLRDHPGTPNAHRVFNSKGESTLGSHLSQPKLLEEGLDFHPDGRPLPGQRISPEELAQLFGLDVDPSQSRMERFHALLNENRSPLVAQQVELLLNEWEELGGFFSWGSGQETSCSLTMWGRENSKDERWALVLYPVSGIAEVVFQHLARRPPFDTEKMRHELLERLNRVARINLPEDAVSRRPNFPLEALLGSGGAELRDVLAWFHKTCQEWQLNRR